MGNAATHYAPHGAYRCKGDDDWISIVVRTDAEWRALCDVVPELSNRAALNINQRRNAQHAIDAALTAWAAPQTSSVAAAILRHTGIPAAALARSGDLVNSGHLAARNFWDKHGSGVLPGLPWRASFGRATGTAPPLGADTDRVLSDVLGQTLQQITELRASGALG
jgi:crotonobetainyl-CoA:carnitine CoA-transferase CaiB-like acyl-CoA transferase